MNSLGLKFKTFLQNKSIPRTELWFLFLISLFVLIDSYKEAFILYFVLLGGMWLVVRNWRLAFYFSSIITLALPLSFRTLEVRTVFFQLPGVFSLSPEKYVHHIFYPLTYTCFFGLGLLLLSLDPRSAQRKGFFQSSDLILHALLLFSGLSTLLSARFSVSFWGFLFFFLGLILYSETRWSLRVNQVREHFFSLLVSIGIFLGAIGCLQYWKQRPLGLFIEGTRWVSETGFSTTDGATLFRASGVFTHPTYYASFLSLLFFPVMYWAIHLSSVREKRWSCIFAIVSGFLILSALVFSLSRSAWLSLLFVLVLLGITHRRRLHFYWERHGWNLFGLVLVLPFFFFIPSVQLRIKSLSDVSSTGSGQGRVSLAGQAVGFALEKPFWGVGSNNFTYYLDRQNLPLILDGFIYPVHNTWLLLGSEFGLLFLMIFLYFLGKNIFITLKRDRDDGEKQAILWGMVTFGINSQFHTLFNQDPTFYLFMIFVGFLALPQKRNRN